LGFALLRYLGNNQAYTKGGGSMGIKLGCKFFAVPHYIVDKELLSKMKGSEAKLYMVLCKLSNRFSRIEIFHSDVQLLQLTGIKDRKTLTRAKRGLRELGVIDYRKRPGFRTDYILIVPEEEEIPEAEGRREAILSGSTAVSMETDNAALSEEF